MNTIRDGEDFDDYVRRCRTKPASIGMMGSVVDLLIKVATAQKVRIEALEAQVKVLEARPAAVDYKGVFDSTTVYQPGNAVTCAGSIWIAKNVTMLRPDEQGDGARDWTLAVKRGRDGRDAKDLR